MEDKEAFRQQRIELLEEAISMVTDEKLMWSQIKQKVDQGDITYIIALNIAKRKIEGILRSNFYLNYQNLRTERLQKM